VSILEVYTCYTSISKLTDRHNLPVVQSPVILAFQIPMYVPLSMYFFAFLYKNLLEYWTV